MRVMLMLVAGLLAAGAAGQTNVVKVGDAYDDVIRALGPPAGTLQAGTFRQLTYDRGRVELRDGRVVSVDLVSPEEAAVRKARQEQEAAAAATRAEQERAARTAEGQAVLRQRRADPALAAASPAEQVAFWKAFQERYPEVNVDAEYAAAARKQQTEARVLETFEGLQQRIRELEQRLTEAEERAANAEAELSRVRSAVYYGPGNIPAHLRPTPRATP